MWEIISAYLKAIITLIGVLIFGIILLKESKKVFSKRIFLLFQIICILQGLTYVYIDGTLKTLIMILTNIVFFKYAFKTTFSKALLIAFLHMILLTIPEILEIIIITKLLGMSNDFFYNTYASSIIANISITILFLIITFLIKDILRKIINIKLEDNKKIIIYYVFTFICISIFFYKAFMYIELNLNFIASIFIIMTFLTILISLIKQTLDNNKLSKEYDKLLEFMTTYENEIENQRILRHETKNEFLTIRAKICDNQENEEIVDYIDEILKDKIKVKQEEYAKFGYLPPNGIKGLCYFKIQEAEGKKIKVSLNISKRIKNSSIYKLSIKEQRDFGRILGVLLDNAIESSCDSKEKQLGIEAYMNSKGEFKMIISNTYINEVDNTKIGRERFSTKGKNRGHGLLLVKHIINEDKIFELNTRVQENIYIQTIKIKKV